MFIEESSSVEDEHLCYVIDMRDGNAPQRWIQYTDAATGEHYYHNPDTLYVNHKENITYSYFISYMLYVVGKLCGNYL
jgi:hypothetical protein